MSEELKPCPNPWCNAKRKPSIIWDLYRRHVRCECGVEGPGSSRLPAALAHMSTSSIGHIDDLDAEAIAAWNTRTDAIPSEDALIRAELDCLAAQGQAAEAYQAKLVALEALELADAALSGANINMRVMERKVKAAIAKLKGDCGASGDR